MSAVENLKNESLHRIKVAYNNIFRKLMNISGSVSMAQILLQYGVNHFDIIVHKLTVSFKVKIVVKIIYLQDT